MAENFLSLSFAARKQITSPEGDEHASANEKRYDRWEELPGGGRRYRLDVPGKLGWLARYLKDVDAAETTVRFWQEIYDDKGELVEIHEKSPVDKGHQKA